MKSSTGMSSSHKAPLTTSTKKPEVKKSSKLTSWPKNAEERKFLYNKYSSGRERLSYQFLELMVKGEDIFKGVTKPVIKRAYLKADEVGDSKTEGLITRKEFPYFLKYLLYFTDLWKAFDKIDDSRKGRLSIDDFVKNRAVLEAKMTKQRAIELFKSMDKDGGGAISFDEFCNWGLEQTNILNYNNADYFAPDNTFEETAEDVMTSKVVTSKEEIKEESMTPKGDVGSVEDLAEKENEVNALKLKICELEGEIQEMQGKILEGGSTEDASEELKRLKNLNEDLTKKLAEKPQNTEGSDHELKRLRSLNDDLGRKLTDLTNGHAGINERLNKLKNSNISLQRKLENSKNASNLNEEFQRLKHLSGDLEKRVFECHCSKFNWRDERLKMRTIHGELEKKWSGSSENAEELRKIKEWHQDFERKVDETSKGHVDLNDEVRRLRVLNKEIEKKLSAMTGDAYAKDKLQRLSNFNNGLDRKIAELNAEHGVLGEKLQKIKRSNGDFEQQLANSKDQKLREHLVKLQSWTSEFEKKWTNCLCTRKNWKEELRRLKSLHSEFETKIQKGGQDLGEDLRKYRKTQKEFEKNIAESAAEHDILREEFTKLNTLRKDLHKKLGEQSGENHLKVELQRLKAIHEESERKLTELMSNHGYLTQKLLKFKTSSSELEIKVSGSLDDANIKEDFKRLKALPTEIDKKLNICSHGHGNLKDDLQKIKDRMKELEKKIVGTPKDASIIEELRNLRGLYEEWERKKNEQAREHTLVREDMVKFKTLKALVSIKLAGAASDAYNREKFNKIKKLYEEIDRKIAESALGEAHLQERLLKFKSSTRDIEKIFSKGSPSYDNSQKLRASAVELEKKWADWNSGYDAIKEQLRRLRILNEELERKLAVTPGDASLTKELFKVKGLHKDLERKRAEFSSKHWLLNDELKALNKISHELEEKVTEEAINTRKKGKHDKLNNFNEEIKKRLEEFNSGQLLLKSKAQKLKNLNAEIEKKLPSDPIILGEYQKLKSFLADFGDKIQALDINFSSEASRLNELRLGLAQKGSGAQFDQEYLRLKNLYTELNKKQAEIFLKHGFLWEEFRKLKLWNKDLNKKITGVGRETQILAELQIFKGYNEEIWVYLLESASVDAHLRGKLLKLRASFAENEKKISPVETQAQGESNKLKSQIDETEKKLAEVATANDDLKGELGKLKNLSGELKNKSFVSEGNSILAESLQKLKFSYRELRTKQAEIMARHEPLRDELKRLKSLNKEFGRKVAGDHDGINQVKRLKEWNRDLLAQLFGSLFRDAKLRDKLEKLRRISQDFERNSTMNNSSLQNINGVIGDLDSKLNGSSKKAGNLIEELQYLKEMNTNLKRKMDNSSGDSDFSVEVEKLKSLHKEVENKHFDDKFEEAILKEEFRKLKNYIGEILKRNDNENKDSSEANKLKEAVENKLEENQNLKAESEQKAKEANDLQKNLELLSKQFENMKNELENKAKAAEEREEALKNELESAKNKFSHTDCMLKIQALENKLSEKEKESAEQNAALSQKVSPDASSHHDCEKKIKELQDIVNKKVDEEKELAQLKKVTPEANHHECEIKINELENVANKKDEELKELAQSQKKLAEESNHRIKELEHLVNKKDDELKELAQSQKISSENSHHECEKRIKELENLVTVQDNLKDKIKSLETNLIESNDKLKAANEINEKLQETGNHHECEARIKELQEGLNQKEENLVKHAHKIKDLQNKLAESEYLKEKGGKDTEPQHHECEAKIKDLQNKLADATNHHECEKKIQSLQESLKEKGGKEAESLHHEYEAKIKELQAKLKEKDEKLTKHHECEEKIKDLQEKLKENKGETTIQMKPEEPHEETVKKSQPKFSARRRRELDARIKEFQKMLNQRGVPAFLELQEVLEDEDDVNMVFLADLYDKSTGLKNFETFTDGDKAGFSILISEKLKDDKDLEKVLPLNPETNDLYDATAETILIGKIVNKTDPNAIDIGKLNRGEKLTKEQKEDNLVKSLDAAKNLGCEVKNSNVSDIENKVPHQVLKLVWEVIKADLKRSISTNNVPNLAELRSENETLEDFAKIKCPEHYLLRWINYHLKNAGVDKKVKNFGSGLKDGKALTYLLNELDPLQCDKSGFNNDEGERAFKIINDAAKLGVIKFISPKDILQGNEHLNLLFCAEIFERNNGLKPKKIFDEKEKKNLARIINNKLKNDKDLADILPINPNDNSLFESLKDGILLNKLIEHEIPEKKDCKKIHTNKPLTPSEVKENLDNVFCDAKSAGAKLDDITPSDIYKGRESESNVLLNEIVNAGLRNQVNTEKVPKLTHLKHPDESLEEFNKLTPEDYLLRWINHHLENAGSNQKVKNFGSDLKDGTALTLLLNQLDPLQCDKSGLQKNEGERAAKVIEDALNLGVSNIINSEDILNENELLNKVFCAELFAKNNGIEIDQFFSDKEKQNFARIINGKLVNDHEISDVLPINPEDNSLFSALKDGIIINKMITDAVPGTVEKIHSKKPLSTDHIKENLTHGISSVIYLGHAFEGVTPLDIAKGKPKALLPILSTIYEADLKRRVNSKSTPNLVELKNQDEALEEFSKINCPKHYLLRWINHHLKNAGSNKEIKNFGSDLQDGVALIILLNQLEPLKFDTAALNSNEEERAKKIIDNASELGVPKFFLPSDILTQNELLNLLLCAEIFERNNGLAPPQKYQEGEKANFARIINERLKNDSDVADRLPLNPNDNSLFSAVKDGIIINKFLNDMVPNTVDAEKINVQKPLAPSQIENNLNEALNGVKKINASGVDNITPSAIAKGNPNEILKLLSEILTAGLKEAVNIIKVPALAELKNKDESVEDFKKIDCPKNYLLRWVNYHLKKADSDKEVKNFGSDLQDGTALTLLLNQLDPWQFDKSGLEKPVEERAVKIIEDASSLGVSKLYSPNDILSENELINLMLVAELFAKNNNLEAEEKYSDIDKRNFVRIINEKLKSDIDLADILPINLDDNSLFNNMKNGILLIKFISLAVPEFVDAKELQTKPLSHSQIKQNLQLGLSSAKLLNLDVENISPQDILKAKPKAIMQLLSEIFKTYLKHRVNPKNVAELVALKKAEETIEDFIKIDSPEIYLLRWVNFYFKGNGKIKNFDADFKSAFTHLAGSVALEAFVNKTLDDSFQIGVPKMFLPEDIIHENGLINKLYSVELLSSKIARKLLEEFEEKQRKDNLNLARIVNERLKNDSDVSDLLPATPDNILVELKDGRIFNKLINETVPGIIDLNAIHLKKPLTHDQINENLAFVLSSAKKIGCQINEETAHDFLEGKTTSFWTVTLAIVKAGLKHQLNPQTIPELLILKKSEISLEDFTKQEPETYLLSWIQYHLKYAGEPKEVQNFTDDLEDGVALAVVLSELDAQFDKYDKETPNEQRVAKVLENSNKLGVSSLYLPSDFLNKNELLNILFCAELLSKKHGLEPKIKINEEEKKNLVRILNEKLKNDPDASQILPINPDDDSLFAKTKDGILFNKFLNESMPGSVHLKDVNVKQPLTPDQQKENLVLATFAAKSVGAQIESTPESLAQGKPNEIMNFLSEILKAEFKRKVNPNSTPVLIELKKPDESPEDFNKINSPEHYLLRWINHHLKNFGSDKQVANFGADLKDGTVLTILLNQLDPIKCDTSSLDKSEEERAAKIINDTVPFGIPNIFKPSDILNGNELMNLMLCVELFIKNNGLESVQPCCQEEKRTFAKIINQDLRGNPDLADVLPINPDNNSLFSCCKDGIILDKLVNDAVPGTIDPRAINLKKPLTPFQIRENLLLGLASAKAIGCKVDEINPRDIGMGKPIEILKLLSEVLKAKPHWNLNLKEHPYLLALKKNEEEIGDLLKLSPEDLLLRWINHHLKKAGNEKEIKNYGEDLADCTNLTLLLNQLDPEKIDKSGLKDDLNKRAQKVLDNSRILGVDPTLSVEDLLAANPTLNYLYTWDIFIKKSGLSLNEAEKFEAAGLLKDDAGDSREERSFRIWVNSLKLPNIHVNNLFEDIRDGIVLLRVLDRIEPGCVDWKKKVENKPNHRLKKIHNANYAIEIGKAMKFSLVNVGGIDLVDCKKKLVLAFLWQMVRKHTLQVLGGWTEEKLLQWAVEKVKKEPKITSFKDKSIANCQFLFNLLAAIEERVINWDIVTPGKTKEEIENNCNYVLSVARKLGATIFLVWEDIKDVNPKMIMTLFAALVKIEKHGKQEEMIDFHKKSDADL